MFLRTAVSRGAQLAARRQACSKLALRRGYAAAPDAASFQYETSQAAGTNIATRDSHGPTAKLAVVAKAGTRYQPLPGLTVGLEEFAFKNTKKRSALRIVRESELLGGQLNAYHTREALVVEANFFREDLPYFTELLAEVISETKYTTYEFHEEVERVLHLKQPKLENDPRNVAIDAAHSVAFHTGLGVPSYPSTSTPLSGYMNENSIAAYAEGVYAKSNIALVADGATPSSLSKWTEQFFKAVPASPRGPLTATSEPSNYFGGEHRISHTLGNSVVIAFPGSRFDKFKPELAVLTALLGGQSRVKWSPGFSLLSKAVSAAPGATALATNFTYSDAGLLAIQISGGASAVRTASLEAVKALKSVSEGSVSKEDVTKAIAKAKFDALVTSESGRSTLLYAGTGLVHTGKPFSLSETAKSIEGVSVDQLRTAAKSILDGKASVAAVGDLFALPYAEELGLKV